MIGNFGEHFFIILLRGILLENKCNKKGRGTGFFCYIPYENENKKIPVMITNNHIIDENIFNENKNKNKNIRVTINDDEKNIDIKIDNDTKFYTNIKEDITIIEIKKEKEIKEFLEIDNNIFDDNENTINILID